MWLSRPSTITNWSSGVTSVGNTKPDWHLFGMEPRPGSFPMRKALVLATWVWLWVAPPRFGGQSVSVAEPSDIIRGTVLNSVTHEPIGRALVFSPDSHFATMTDDQGRFQFVLPAPVVSRPKTAQHQIQPKENASLPASDRPSQLMARKPGFLESDIPQSSGIGLEQKEVTLSLTPEALIVGRVALSDDADRMVTELYRREIQDGHARWMSSGTTPIRSGGEFRFAGLSAGAYKLLTQESLDRDSLGFDPHAQAYGYPPVFFPAAPDLATAATIELSAGDTFEATLSPTRQAYYPVKVPLANAPALTGLRSAVFARGRPSPGFSLGYNQQSQMLEGLLPAGIYTLEVLSYDPDPRVGTLNLTVKNAEVQSPPLSLVPRASIAVNVREEFTSTGTPGELPGTSHGSGFGSKGPRRYLNVALWPAEEFSFTDPASQGQPSSPADDALTILNVQPGAYWVQVNSARGFPASISSGGTDLLHHPYVVGSGGAAAAIDITMRDDWAHFSAKIERPNDAARIAPPNPGPDAASGMNATPVWVCLAPLPDSPGQFQEISMSSMQESVDVEVSPGEYRVLVFDRPGSAIEYRNAQAMRAYDGKGQVVRFVAGQREQVTLSLIPASEMP
jgi:hypothetical protein